MSYVKASPLLGDRTLPDSESEKKDRRVTQPVTSGERVSRGRRQEVDMPVSFKILHPVCIPGLVLG